MNQHNFRGIKSYVKVLPERCLKSLGNGHPQIPCSHSKAFSTVGWGSKTFGNHKITVIMFFKWILHSRTALAFLGAMMSLTEQFANKPTCAQSSHRIVNPWTSQLVVKN